MSELEPHQSPIFVGGTGRSGTTIMGKYLASHKNIAMPTAENQLIVPQDGLRTLIEVLSQEHDNKAEHAAVQRFVDYSEALRQRGFKNTVANFSYRVAEKALRLSTGKGITLEKAARAVPFTCSRMGIGSNYGHAHYDNCIDDLLKGIIERTDREGIFAAEGLIKPFYHVRPTTRSKLLRFARKFLEDLNKPSLANANASRWCDTTPLNVRYADFLNELYPKSKLVHVVRDPRDVAASYIKQTWTSRNRETALEQLRKRYSALISIQKARPRSFMKTIRLEDFTNNRNGERKELCEFLSIDHAGFDGTVRLSEASFGRWKKDFSTSEARKLESIFEDACDYFGYP